MDDCVISEDMVNCRRAEREFEVGLEQTLLLRSQYPNLPLVFLCDGSLIFWHLESKSQYIKERFLKKYLDFLEEFYSQKIVIAGYISLPKSKELVSLLRNCIEMKLYQEQVSFDTIIDTDLIRFFLPSEHHSTIFIHNSAIAAQYPAHLRPCFLYINLGTEIGRIEFPQWVAQDPQSVAKIVGIIKDQAQKGHGYPVVLSEAHEQAVVKGPDREFFFDMLFRLGLSHNHRLLPSQKSLKKRFVSV